MSEWRGDGEVAGFGGLAGADLTEEDRDIGDLINPHPGPETGATRDGDTPDREVGGISGSACHVSICIINHVQVSIDIDLDH